MNRRRFVNGGGACCAMAAMGARAQESWIAPARLSRPELSRKSVV